MITCRHFEAYFGACPSCDNPGETTYPYTNAGRSHWFYCETHKTRWWGGANLFSSWKRETEEEQQAEIDRIGLLEFREVDAVYGEPDEKRCARCDREAFEAIRQSLQAAIAAQPSLAADKNIENAVMVAISAIEARVEDEVPAGSGRSPFDSDDLPF
jgi:hypothetical protein